MENNINENSYLFDTYTVTVNNDNGETDVSIKVINKNFIDEVIKNGRGKKIKVFHYRPKKKSRKTQGHRQAYTLVEVKKING